MTTGLTTSSRLQAVHDTIAPLRQGLLEHPLYARIDNLPAMYVFMQHHVFAVWDFMLLLKALQQEICPAGVPWLPPHDATASRMINEIVLGEESDEDGAGGFASHFELYRQSMQQAGADTVCIDAFTASLANGATIDGAFQASNSPDSVSQFVLRTSELAQSGDLCAIASAFTFGREDLLPDVFQKIVDRLNFDSDGQLTKFQYYLSRHIELDADEHGPMAARLIESLCGDDESRWQVVERAALNSLQARLDLWDAVNVAVS